MDARPELIEPLLGRAEEAVRRGELWRAKEMLQGGIRSGRYDPRLFERLGLVLLRMGDLVEAGKYLFLSGARDSSYLEPIRLFVDRYRTKAAKQPLALYYTFPRAARLGHRGEYPAVVARDLAELGFPETLPAPHRSQAASSGGLGPQLMALGCFALIVLVLGLAVIGGAAIIQWVRS